MNGVWRRHWKRYAFLIAVSAALIIGLILEANPSQLAEKLVHVDVALLAAVVVLYIISLTLRAFRWFLLLLAANYRVSGKTTFVQFSIAQALNDLTPVKVLGEVARIWGMNKEEGVPIGSGLATVVAEKIMDLVLVTAVLIASIVLLYPDLSLSSWATLTFFVVLVVSANAVIILVLRRPDTVERFGRWISRAVRRIRQGEWAEGLERSIVDTVRSFNQALASTRGSHRGLMTVAAVLTIPIWGLEFARLFFILAALGSFASLPAVVVASTLALTVQVFLPAGSGNVAVITDVFAATGIALATATAAGLLSIATSIWISVPIALVALLVTGRRVDTEELENAELIETESEAPGPTARR